MTFDWPSFRNGTLILFLLMVLGVILGIYALILGIRCLITRRIVLSKSEVVTGRAALIDSVVYLLLTIALLGLIFYLWLNYVGSGTARWEIDFPFPFR